MCGHRKLDAPFYFEKGFFGVAVVELLLAFFWTSSSMPDAKTDKDKVADELIWSYALLSLDIFYILY